MTAEVGDNLSGPAAGIFMDTISKQDAEASLPTPCGERRGVGVSQNTTRAYTRRTYELDWKGNSGRVLVECGAR